MGSVQDPAAAATSQANREEVDSRSIFVGNVDYSPKRYAYVEFLEAEAVQEALLLNEYELRDKQLKVTTKRTNIPGMKPYHPRRSNPFMQPRDPYMAPYFFAPYEYGKVPRLRMATRYNPYY
ncbi:hypothetical protein V6N12_011726 [Hibiscus sabdariffa]|uniref:RRM domain-containing protein n=1 Tax=Hibiscus sabdariffa TaxID=183260 RepID=A0ABR2BUP8_9ROSI